MKLKPETVAKAIKSWHIRFPSQGRVIEALPLLASEYYEDLVDDFSEELFQVAARKVRKFSEFFPRVADFYKVRDECIGEIARAKEEKQKRLALPERTAPDTPEEIERNKQRIAIIWKAINKEMPLDEAMKKVKELSSGYAAKGPGAQHERP